VLLGSHANKHVNEWRKKCLGCPYLGEWYYLSPEVISSGVYDAKADVWALGMLLLEMISGNKPAFQRYNREA
jgi:serine/threonine protein kinase